MSKKTGVVEIHGREYKTVALRVSEFREHHPDWGIRTEIVESGEKSVVMGAAIMTPDGFIVGTGYAEENRSASQINRTSALENCETSAIGRALAACGYGGTEYASANEVENAIHQQQTSKVNIPNDVKKKVMEQMLDAIENADAHAVHEVMEEFDADEKVVLWGMFNSQQRKTIKELLKEVV